MTSDAAPETDPLSAPPAASPTAPPARLTRRGVPIDPTLRVLALGALVNRASGGAVFTTFALYFTRHVGLGATQVGLALSTPYDDRVIKNIKTNEIAVRSAVLLSLGDTTEDQIASEKGKQQLQLKLAKAINATLQQKEGFGGVSNVYFTNFVVQ